MNKKVKVLVSSLDSNGDYLKAGTYPEVDDKTYKKLKALKNIRDYDEKLDGEVDTETDNSELQEKVTALEEDKVALDEKVTALEEDKVALDEKVTALEEDKLMKK